MELITRNLAELKAADYNPRVALQPGDPEFEKIEASIEAFGYCDPIIINKDGTIIGGHQRATVMRHMGIKEAQCVVVDLSKDKEKALNIALNKITGRWDDEKLRDLLIEINTGDLDVKLTGFDGDELSEILGGIDVENDVSEDTFDEDEDEVAPTTQPGQVWALGQHRLMCGDSTSVEDVQKLMGGLKADMLLTDPPYNENYEGKTKDKLKIKNDKMGSDAFLNFLTDANRAADSAMKPGAAFYIWYSSTETCSFNMSCTDIGWDIRQMLVWVKNQFCMGRSDYQNIHEPCLYGWKGGAPHYFIDRRNEITVIEDQVDINKMTKDELKAFCKRMMEPTGETDILREKRNHVNDVHPTMKPVKLFARLIANSSRPGENVLDIFGGSGTTIVACEQLNRRAFVMELDPHYADVIIARWEKLTGGKAELVK